MDQLPGPLPKEGEERKYAVRSRVYWGGGDPDLKVLLWFLGILFGTLILFCTLAILADSSQTRQTYHSSGHTHNYYYDDRTRSWERNP